MRATPFALPCIGCCTSRELPGEDVADGRLTEPIILVLIMTNVVVLTIQAAPALFEPREGGSFLRTWEDYVLFALFIVFT